MTTEFTWGRAARVVSEGASQPTLRKEEPPSNEDTQLIPCL